ncbi:MAG: hypothetical protein ILNGONEN_02187 [Syntrophorhabdaceae bacterium]|nr:hypothetical protein [Syntrophorhabdaceae bacterium]
MFQFKTFFHRLFRDPYPGDIPLPYMHNTLGLIDQMVVLTLEYWLKVFLKIPSGDLCKHCKMQSRSWCNISNIWPYYFNPSVLNLFHALHGCPFNCNCPTATHLNIYVFTPNPFTLKRRTIRNRYRYLCNLNLKPPYLNCPLDYLVMRNIGNHMFISTDTCR